MLLVLWAGFSQITRVVDGFYIQGESFPNRRCRAKKISLCQTPYNQIDSHRMFRPPKIERLQNMDNGFLRPLFPFCGHAVFAVFPILPGPRHILNRTCCPDQFTGQRKLFRLSFRKFSVEDPS